MQKFTVRRLLSVIPVLSVVSVVISTLPKIVPDSLAATLLGDLVTMDDIAKLEKKIDLNRPSVEQYFIQIGNMFHGDFGISTAGGEPVASVAFSHVEPTVSLALYAPITASVIVTPMGMLATKNKGTDIGHGVTVLPLAGISLPSSLFDLFLILILAVKLHLFPASGYVEISWRLWPHIKSLTLPTVALGFMNAALMMHMIHSAMLEVLSSDYIRMTKARGVRNFAITTEHALCNSLVVIITMIGQSTVQMLAGTAVIESLFAIPGFRQLMVNSIGYHGYYVIQAIVLLIALFNVPISMLVGLLYDVTGPRIKAA